ncbi:MAG: PEP-CTERM sorting domain-containing protein [Pseudomonadales bacterium]
MFNSIRNTIIGAILTLAATSASALPITFDFSGSGHRLLGYSQTFSQSGLGVKATALGGGRLSQTHSGLGVGGTHFLDSKQLDGFGPDESVLFRFSRSVRLLGFTLTRVGYFDDATLTVDDVPQLSGNIPGGNIWDSDTASIKAGLNGTDFQFGVTDWNDDYFIKSLTVHATEVPEPGTIALFAVGLVGLGIARKRTKQ